MKLKSRALKSRENDRSINSNNEEPPQRTRRLKRIIIDESSSEGSDSSNDEDDIPLFQRKAVIKTLDKKGVILKKIKISAEKEDSVDIKRKPLSVDFKQPIQPGFQAPSKELKAPMAPPSDSFKVPSNNFKTLTTTLSNGFKKPMAPPSNGFKAPLAPPSNGFKAPLALSSNDFKVPVAPSANSFKAPPNNFKAPMPEFVESQRSSCKDISFFWTRDIDANFTA